MKTCVHTKPCMNGHSIMTTKKWKAISYPSCLNDKQNVGYHYNRTLLGRKKEWSIVLCYYLDGPREHYVKKEARHKRPCFMISLMRNLHNRQIHTECNRIVIASGWGRRDREWLLMGKRSLLGMIKTFQN